METTKKKQTGMIFAYVVSTVCAYIAIRSMLQFFDPTGHPTFADITDIPLWYWWKRFLGPMLYTAIIGLILKVLEGAGTKSPYVEAMRCICLVPVMVVWIMAIGYILIAIAGSWTAIARKIFFL